MPFLPFYRDEEGIEKDESGAISGRECYQSGASMASGVPESQTSTGKMQPPAHLAPALCAFGSGSFLRYRKIRGFHGRHLPLGNDAPKAHGILVKAAEQFGGVVYPPCTFMTDFPGSLWSRC